MTTTATEILTVGHSTLSYESFLSLIRSANITAIADVRSSPYSKQFPHFERELLKAELRADRIAYSFLGHQLGGRPSQKHLFNNGVADYERMAQESDFKIGLDRIFEGSKRFRIALMCSEHNPLECHRCLLVGRALADSGAIVNHLLSNGRAMDQPAVENALLSGMERQTNDLFSNKERIAAAYRKQASKVAFVERPPLVGSQTNKKIAAGRPR